jgi:hypothetical protein
MNEVKTITKEIKGRPDVCEKISVNSHGNSSHFSFKYGVRKVDSHIACRAHAVPMPCRAAKGLECVIPT